MPYALNQPFCRQLLYSMRSCPTHWLNLFAKIYDTV